MTAGRLAAYGWSAYWLEVGLDITSLSLTRGKVHHYSTETSCFAPSEAVKEWGGSPQLQLLNKIPIAVPTALHGYRSQLTYALSDSALFCVCISTALSAENAIPSTIAAHLTPANSHLLSQPASVNQLPLLLTFEALS
jgi:hypothetical protein